MQVLSQLCKHEAMKSLEKEKMCISCEGRIAFDAQTCPYCGTHQTGRSQASFQAPIFQNQSLEDSLTSLYTPPYMGKRSPFFQPSETSIEEPPMNYNDHPIYKEVTEKPQMDPLLGATVEEEKASPQNSFFSTLLLAAGANFSIIGLMQLFFSKNGVLRLEWNASYWFFYCLIGAPLLYFGLKKVRALRD